MLVIKMGNSHIERGLNCQDYGFVMGTGIEEVKCVVDGCSGGKHSEVGAKLFCELRQSGFSIEQSFERLLSLWQGTGQNLHRILDDFLCFTILEVVQTQDDFKVTAWGDGYIILEDLEGQLSFIPLGADNEPPYYAYKYADVSKLKKFKDGVRAFIGTYPKSQYKGVGVATDGIRYPLKESNMLTPFKQYLQEQKETRLKLLINQNISKCEDDIGIAF